MGERTADRAIVRLPPTSPETRPQGRRYHVALTPKEVLERLSAVPGVKAYEAAALPDFGGLVDDSEYTLELGDREFTLHCGPPAARGQSATGMFRMLYLRGRMSRTNEGTLVELGFAYRRPRWATLRWAGFLALASMGLVWVLVGPGDPSKKALLYGLLVAVLVPVVVSDVRRAKRLEDQRRTLLNLLEHSFGPIQIEEPHPDEPYRRRMLAGGHGPEDEDYSDDADYDFSDDADYDSSGDHRSNESGGPSRAPATSSDRANDDDRD